MNKEMPKARDLIYIHKEITNQLGVRININIKLFFISVPKLFLNVFLSQAQFNLQQSSEERK